MQNRYSFSCKLFKEKNDRMMKNIFNASHYFGKNKVSEFQVYFSFQLLWSFLFEIKSDKEQPINIGLKLFGIFDLSIIKKLKSDHAGIYIDISLLGLCLSFSFYDTRHWDYDNNC